MVDKAQQSAKAVTLAWLILAGLTLFWAASLLSFSPADPPGHAVFPPNDPPANWCGRIGAVIAYYTFHSLGAAGWLALAIPAAMVIARARGAAVSHPWVRIMGAAVMVVAAASLQALWMPASGSAPEGGGGVLGIALSETLKARFNGPGTALVLMVTLGIGALVAVDEWVLAAPAALLRTLGLIRRVPVRPVVSAAGRFGTSVAGSLRPASEAAAEPVAVEPVRKSSTRGRRKEIESPIDPEAGGLGAVHSFDPDQTQPQPEPIVESAPSVEVSTNGEIDMEALREKIRKLPINFASRPRKTAEEPERSAEDDSPGPVSYEGYQFPPLDLLLDPESSYTEQIEEFVREQAEVLEHALRTYRIDGEVVRIDSGPVITLYEVQLAPGTKVASIQSVNSDIARALRAPNIRIVANMAGKTTVGIEVPNLKKERVRLKELMTSGKASKMQLPMYLGKDASGAPVIQDLTAMPHMLIAGTTGSGKSVCINTILMSFLYTKRPNELKLILVDPKMVEMTQFRDIPHLMCPVVTEMGKAAAILQWAVTKMGERYELLSEVGVRDIAAYNELGWEGLEERLGPMTEEEAAKVPKRLPYIVFVIDELADLIMTNREVEEFIVRVAQKARAVGIHLILATQRPQANVVTGLIKSNMPCRVSFKVASGMDSRIVLDAKGAELLLGQGDMLVLTPRSSELVRAQGTLVEDNEIRKTVKFLKEIAAPNYERQLLALRSTSSAEADAADDEEGLDATKRDPRFIEAVDIVVSSQRGSVSLLQRRMGIGYTRSSRLIDQMGLAGIIGEHKGTVSREVLVSPQEWEQMREMMEKEDAEGTLFSADDDADSESADAQTGDEAETAREASVPADEHVETDDERGADEEPPASIEVTDAREQARR